MKNYSMPQAQVINFDNDYVATNPSASSQFSNATAVDEEGNEIVSGN